MLKEVMSREEQEMCRRVVYAFEDELILLDCCMVDLGKYGFVKLQYFSEKSGFDTSESFYDAEELFEDLWDDYLMTKMLAISKGTPMQDLNTNDIYERLPKEMKDSYKAKKEEFRKRAGM